MKFDRKLFAAAGLGLAGLFIASCQTTPPPGPATCRADAAERLTGMNRVTDQQARDATGATIVRQITPGQGVTMDYRQERVTIETDPATGKIVRAACG